jgi:hypothetical protein
LLLTRWRYSPDAVAQDAGAGGAETATATDKSDDSGARNSLLDAEPSLYNAIIRYPK